jgi:hypothetical protein
MGDMCIFAGTREETIEDILKILTAEMGSPSQRRWTCED